MHHLEEDMDRLGEDVDPLEEDMEGGDLPDLMEGDGRGLRNLKNLIKSLVFSYDLL